MKKNKFKLIKKNAIYTIPVILIIWSIFVFFGILDFMPKAQSYFLEVIPHKENLDFVYIIEINFESNGSFIAGKPVDVDVKVFFNNKNPNNAHINWKDVEIGIGGQECYIYKDKITPQGKKFHRMVKLNKNKDKNIFSTKQKVIFEQSGNQLVFSMLYVDGKPAVINKTKFINIEERSVWLSVVQNRIALSLTFIALALTLIQMFREFL